MPTTLRLMMPADRPTLDRLWQLYRHDLSAFRESHPDQHGLFPPGRLPSWFEGDQDRCGYLLEHDGSLAGFALLRGLLGPRLHVGEFFVVRSMRRHGVGHAAAVRLLELHPGAWEIAFQDENPKAARFWRRLAADVAGAAWTEERRPVPDKPHLPPDVWISLDTT